MEYDALEALYANLQALYEKGDEEAAQKLIGEEFPKLSEEIQGEILNRMYFKTLEDQNEQAAILADVQKKGIETLDALDAMEKVLGNSAPS